MCILILASGFGSLPVGALERDYVPNQTAAVVAAAQRLYGENVTVFNATDSLFGDVFPNHEIVGTTWNEVVVLAVRVADTVASTTLAIQEDA